MSGRIFLEFLKSLGRDDSALFLSGDRVLRLKSTEISDYSEELQLPLPLSFPHLPHPMPCVQSSRNSRARAHRFSLSAYRLPKLCTV